MEYLNQSNFVKLEIIDAPIGHKTSPIYLYNEPFKFASYFYRNGETEETEGIIDWILHLLSLPTSIFSIRILFAVVLMETDDCYSCNITFNHHKMKVKLTDFMRRNDLIINSSQLTFKIFIKTLEARGQHNELILDEYSQKLEQLHLSYLPSAALVWSTNDEQLMRTMKGYHPGNFKTTNIFDVKGLKLMMKIYPNGRDMDEMNAFCVEIMLITIPPKLSSISFILDTKLRASGYTAAASNHSYGTFSVLNPNQMSICCKRLCTFEEFQQMHAFSLSVEILFADIFDQSGDSVLDQYDNTANDCKLLKMPSDSHKWYPDNTKEILNAPNSKYFQSDIFELQSLKWMLQVRMF